MKYILALLLLFTAIETHYNTSPPPAIIVELPSTKELSCLIRNVYYEARGESKEGQMAVTWVTLNRLKTHANTICKVVYQPHQFSWTANIHKLPKIDMKVWEVVKSNVLLAYTIKSFDATHYHNLTVHPKWNLKYVTQIDNHIFYKDKKI